MWLHTKSTQPKIHVTESRKNMQKQSEVNNNKESSMNELQLQSNQSKPIGLDSIIIEF